MTETQVIKLVFGILLSLGSGVLLFLSFSLFYKYLVQEKKCTLKTTGVVRKYTLASRGGGHSGIHLPVVYYTVEGKEYKVIGPEYKLYITKNKRGSFSKNAVRYEEDDQIFRLNRNSNASIGIYENPMRKLYPPGSEIDIYYDPVKPKLAYVLRYCNKKWLFGLMFLSGIFVLLVDLSIWFFL